MASGYLRLRKELAELLFEQHQMMLVQGPNLEARWQQLFGPLVVELEQLLLEHRRLRRSLEILRAAHVKGEQVDPEVLERQLAQELWEHRRRLTELKDKQDAAEQRLRKLRSPETSAALRSLYRQLVKRLHPDLHPQQDARQQQLWFEVQQAYQWGDFARLETLAAVTDDDFEERPGETERLRQRLRELSQDLQEMRQQFPFSHRSQLEDEGWIQGQIHRYKLEIVLERQRLARTRAVFEEFR